MKDEYDDMSHDELKAELQKHLADINWGVVFDDSDDETEKQAS